MRLQNACRTKQRVPRETVSTLALAFVHPPALVHRMCELGIGLKTMKYIEYRYDGDAVTRTGEVWNA